MISPTDFVRCLQDADVGAISGVPDSSLSPLIRAIEELWPAERHLIAPNEGAAIGHLIGNYLATGRVGVTYLQNSGLGNAINPLVSLATSHVYGIPILMVIGWRGEPSSDGNNSSATDEPQHILQGAITLRQLDLLEIPWRILGNSPDSGDDVGEMIQTSRKLDSPAALIVRRGTFQDIAPKVSNLSVGLTRHQAISLVLKSTTAETPVVGTTGLISREIYSLSSASAELSGREFYSVGGMGHAVSVAVGIARGSRGRKVVCIDGDGSLCMHTGELFVSALQSNLIHIVLNNESHFSVGGQPTVSKNRELHRIAKAAGYHYSVVTQDERELSKAIGHAVATTGSYFIEVLSSESQTRMPSRPTETPVSIKRNFMNFLRVEP